MILRSFLAAAALSLVGTVAEAGEQRGVIQVSLIVVPQCQVQSSAVAPVQAACTAGAAYKVETTPTPATTATAPQAQASTGQVITVTF